MANVADFTCHTRSCQNFLQGINTSASAEVFKVRGNCEIRDYPFGTRRPVRARRPSMHEEEHADAEDQDERGDKETGVEVQVPSDGVETFVHFERVAVRFIRPCGG